MNTAKPTQGGWFKGQDYQFIHVEKVLPRITLLTPGNDSGMFKIFHFDKLKIG